MAPASFGQALSLSGETFETVPALGQQTTFGPYTCNKAGTTVIPFQTQGAALGPYFGAFTETGTITIGPQTDTTFDSRGTGVIVGFQASFTITSQVPTGTVTGTKQLAPTQPPPATHQAVGRCDPERLLAARHRGVRGGEQPVRPVHRPDQRGHGNAHRQRHEQRRDRYGSRLADHVPGVIHLNGAGV